MIPRLIILCLASAVGAPAARAQPPATPTENRPADPEAREGLEDTANLDGIVAAAGPVGSGLVIDGDWVGTFGAELSLTRIRERSPLVAAGTAVGGVRFAGRDAGLLWLDLAAATRGPVGVPVGASVGATLSLDQFARPRPGVQGTLWVFLGVIPFVRTGWVDGSGLLIEAGLKIALPVVRWK